MCAGLVRCLCADAVMFVSHYRYLSLRNHQLRGLDHPRKRACLTAMHNFFLTRSDGTTAAEQFFGRKPRSMFAAILESVEIPPAPLGPPRRALGYAQRM